MIYHRFPILVREELHLDQREKRIPNISRPRRILENWQAYLEYLNPGRVVVYISPRAITRIEKPLVDFSALIGYFSQERLTDQKRFILYHRKVMERVPPSLPTVDQRDTLLITAKNIAKYGAHKCGHQMDVFLVHRNPRRPTKLELEYLVREDPSKHLF